MRASVLALLLSTPLAWSQVQADRDRPDTGSNVRQSTAAATLPPPARHAPATSNAAHATAPLTMVGVFREFPGGHPDLRARQAPGRHAGILGDQLDDDGRPVFVSRGYRVLRPGHDATGEPVIGPRRYIEPRRGDRAPRVDFVEGEAVESARSLDALFRDVPGVNRPTVRPIVFRLSPADEGVYEAEVEVSGVGQGAEPRARPGTVELHGRFVHRAGAGARLRFTSADHLWVFIDGRLVIDLGGTGAPVEAPSGEAAGPAQGAQTATQSVQLDRLPWLRDGAEHEVRVFCAARAAGPPVRIEALMRPGSAPAPALAEIRPATIAND